MKIHMQFAYKIHSFTIQMDYILYQVTDNLTEKHKWLGTNKVETHT